MESQTDHPYVGHYHLPYSNPNMREGPWLPEPYYHTPDYYQSLSTVAAPPPAQGIMIDLHCQPQVMGDAEYSTTSDDADATQVYPHSFDTGDLPINPIGGMVAVNTHGGTATTVYDPLPQNSLNYPNVSCPSQEDSQVVVPQPPYKCGNTQKKWDQKQSILFFTEDRPGVKLPDAWKEEFKGICGRDNPAFGTDCSGITIRIHFPGYPSSTDVEKELKKLAGSGQRPKARSMQLSAKNYKAKPNPVTISKLAQEVSKRIMWHIEDLEANSDLFPFNDRVGEKWRLGQGRMRFEYMVITELNNVSSGSWSPVICIV